MVSRESVEKQLKRVGCNFRFWGRSELEELCNILLDTETIAFCVNGRYQGGFALLCATDHRLLLVDKKPMGYLTVEDVRFEMISQFDYSHRLLDATINICTTTKTLSFTSWNQQRLRALISYVQQRVIEIRQYYSLAQQFQNMSAAQGRLGGMAYVPSLAYQASTGATGPSVAASNASSGIGARLPHFRRRTSDRQLGNYALDPDEVYQGTSKPTTAQDFQGWLT